MYKFIQLSIFLENQKGNLYVVTDLLAQNDLNIKALFLADTSEFGILRLVVPDYKKAKRVLEEKHYIVKETPVICAVMDDVPGGLSSILKILRDEDIDLEYLYAIAHGEIEKAGLLLHTKDLDQLEEVLLKNDIPLVPSELIYNAE